jgi:putative phosphonate metabolism protein
MPETVRYALYYVPSAASALYRFGASMIGYDAYAACDLPFPEAPLQSFPDWSSMTKEPRIYGFHATLKAPFALADGASEADVLAAFGAFAQTPRAIPQIAPVVRAIGRFIAIVPDTSVAELNSLAADCVRAFDHLRAPLTEHDRNRRLKSPLTANQIALLDRWGYPYVFEEFRFHMTLSGSLPQETREPAQELLQSQFAMLGLRTLTVDSLTLLRQEGSKTRFVVMKQAALTRA